MWITNSQRRALEKNSLICPLFSSGYPHHAEGGDTQNDQEYNGFTTSPHKNLSMQALPLHIFLNN
jgi:hypothetical protein